MKFTVTHTRAFAGNNITVVVEAESHEGLRWVDVVLDAEDLEAIDLAPGQESYTREFSSVGEAGPGTNHTLEVTATDAHDQTHGSTTQWTDAS